MHARDSYRRTSKIGWRRQEFPAFPGMKPISMGGTIIERNGGCLMLRLVTDKRMNVMQSPATV